MLPCVGTYSSANTKHFAYRPPHIFCIETFAQALHPMTEVLIEDFVRNWMKTTHPTWQYFAFTVMGNNDFFYSSDFICNNRNLCRDFVY